MHNRPGHQFSELKSTKICPGSLEVTKELEGSGSGEYSQEISIDNQMIGNDGTPEGKMENVFTTNPFGYHFTSK